MNARDDSPFDARRGALAADRVFDGRRWHDHAAVLVEAGRIRGVAAAAEVPNDWPVQRLPAGVLIAPGFIDLQVNGGGGRLLNDEPTAETMRAIARAHRTFGTTACLPTLITDTREQIKRAVAAAARAAGSDGVLGLHLEGPFLSPKRPGVHRADLVVAPGGADDEWLGALDNSKVRWLMTLAPECVPARFVQRLSDAGVRVSAGHSEASADTMMRAIDEGLTGVTHLFNAMPPMTGREPGIVGAALAEQRITAGIIMDGIHVNPLSAQAAFRAKGPDGMALVTDAMPTVGATIDHFLLMGRDVRREGDRLSLGNGTLAGAHLDMASAVRNAVNLAGISLADALQSASRTPAKFLGLEKERGALIPQARADLVALTPDLRVTATWVAGEASSIA